MAKKKQRRTRRPLGGGSVYEVAGRPGWYVKLRNPATGKRVQEKAAVPQGGRDDRENAEQYLRDRIDELRAAHPVDGQLREVSLAEFLDEFYELEESRVTPRHMAELRRRLDRAAMAFGEMQMSAIDKRIAEDYVTALSRERGRLESVPVLNDDGTPEVDADGKPKFKTIAHEMTAATLRVHRSALATCWTAAIDRQAAADNPWLKVRLPKGQQFVARLLTADEVAAIIARARPQVRPLFTFLAETGLRLSEALALTWPRVERDFAKFIVEKSKSGRSRTVHTTTRAKAILDAAWKAHVTPLRGEDRVFTSYTRSYVSHCFADACDKAGVGRGARLHDLRHFVGTSLAQAGVPIPTIMGILGHSQISTTQRYAAHLPANAAAQAMAAFDAVRTASATSAKKAQ
jgi:integrase